MFRCFFLCDFKMSPFNKNWKNHFASSFNAYEKCCFQSRWKHSNLISGRLRCFFLPLLCRGEIMMNHYDDYHEYDDQQANNFPQIDILELGENDLKQFFQPRVPRCQIWSEKFLVQHLSGTTLIMTCTYFYYSPLSEVVCTYFSFFAFPRSQECRRPCGEVFSPTAHGQFNLLHSNPSSVNSASVLISFGN